MVQYVCISHMLELNFIKLSAVQEGRAPWALGDLAVVKTDGRCAHGAALVGTHRSVIRTANIGLCFGYGRNHKAPRLSQKMTEGRGRFRAPRAVTGSF
jgi:hypothetical protein